MDANEGGRSSLKAVGNQRSNSALSYIKTSVSVRRNPSDKITYIANCSSSLLIPQQRDGVPSLIFRIRTEIHLMQIILTEEVIHCCTWVLVIRAWESPSRPTIRVAFRIRFDNANVDKFCETLQVADEICSVREGTEESDVEVIAAIFGGELGAGDDAMPSISGCWRVNTVGCISHWVW